MTFDRHDFSLRFLNNYYMIYLLWVATRYLFCIFSAQQKPPSTMPRKLLHFLVKTYFNFCILPTTLLSCTQMSSSSFKFLCVVQARFETSSACRYIRWLFVKKAAGLISVISIIYWRMATALNMLLLVHIVPIIFNIPSSRLYFVILPIL